MSGGCDGSSTFDAGAPSQFLQGLPTATDSIELVVEDVDGQSVTDPALQVGLGLYSLPEDNPRVLGTQLPQLVEAAGRTWELERHITLRPEDRSWQESPLDERPRLVQVVSRQPIDLTTSVSGQTPQSIAIGVTWPVTSDVGIVDSVDSVELMWRPRGDDDPRVAVVLYRPLGESDG